VEIVRRRFPHEYVSVPRARHDLLAWLDVSTFASGTGCDSAALVLSELVSNAVLHASPLPDGTLEVVWRRIGQKLMIEVMDAGGPEIPQVMDVGAESVSGRGLTIVESVALDWWVSREGTWRRVHALVEMG
jgi:serine/threonine-protein kinase RsbW